MAFTLKMAWKDSRASRGRLVLFSLSIVLGIAALVALGSLSVNLTSSIHDQAQSLLGADVSISSRSLFSPGLEDKVKTLGAKVARGRTFTAMLVFPSQVGATRLVQVKAQEDQFPFYGEISTEPSGVVSVLKTQQAILLEQSLMTQYRLHIGDQVKLGKLTFTVAGVLKKIPGESLAASLLPPRVYIPYRLIEETGLSGKGSLVSYSMSLQLPQGVDPDKTVTELKAALPKERISFETVVSRQKQLGRVVDNVTAFLSLAGFISLILGSIGVASAVHVYITQKRATVALMRCLGARGTQSFGVYLVQGLALGLLGSLLGGLLGVIFQLLVPIAIKQVLPLDITFALSYSSLFRGIGAGCIISSLFTVMPLLTIRNISPLETIRTSSLNETNNSVSLDPYLLGVILLLTFSVLLFAITQTHSVALGLGFVGFLGLGFIGLYAVARFVQWITKKINTRSLPFVLRQGIANLYRPNNRTSLLLVSLGLGTFLTLTLFLTRTSLLRELSAGAEGASANLLFVDIQSDQIDDVSKLLEDRGAPLLRKAPIVSMKMTAVGHVPVDEITRTERKKRGGWALKWDYRTTYRSALTPSEHIIKGSFVGKVPENTQIIPISVEKSLVDDLGLNLGDAIDWDLQGVTLHTVVSSVRTVEWRRLETNFLVVFPEGVLESAPQFYVGAVRALSPEASGLLQRAVVEMYPNIAAIDLQMVQETLDNILSKIGYVVEFMALFIVATGLLVLACAVINGRYQRRREAVLLKTLGASIAQLRKIQATEYALLGVLAASVGCFFAFISSSVLAHTVFHTSSITTWWIYLIAIVSVAALTLITGRLSDKGLEKLSALEMLRSEQN